MLQYRPMIYIGSHTILPQQNIYYTLPHLYQQVAGHTVSNPPFVTDVTPLDAPTAPGKTLPATTIIERLRRDTDA